LERVGSSASGNPLFAEELVAMIAESGPAAGIPSVIKLLIASRLDALPHAEHSLVQLAAVYGKVFWQGGLRPLGAGTDVSELLESLDQKDLVRAAPASQFHGDREYTFKHDLIRDVAYEMLPRAERRRLHGRAADWLEAAAGEQVDAYLDQLAHHASQAGQLERALDYLRRAAERAAPAGFSPSPAAAFFSAAPGCTPPRRRPSPPRAASR
jgi:predicted ATPase